jgi:hypothetical protein
LTLPSIGGHVPFAISKLIGLDEEATQPPWRDVTMDPKLLADALMNFLAPALPYLVAGGEKAVGWAGKKISEDGLEIAKKLWGKLQPKVEASPMGTGAVEVLEADPEDSDARGTLRLQIRQILAADLELAEELARLLPPAVPTTTYQAANYGPGAIAQGPGAVAAGAGGIVVGGNVHGGIQTGGDRRGPKSEE